MKGEIFNSEMIRAILDGRKTKTRRIIPIQPSNYDYVMWTVACSTNSSIIGKNYWASKNQINDYKRDEKYFKPKYKVGDIIYVRETFLKNHNGYLYKASIDDDQHLFCKWKPSIHMPKSAARIFLKVTNVRCERLQDITEEDAIKEGIEFIHSTNNILNKELTIYHNYLSGEHKWMTAKLSFESLWKSIYSTESWQANPFVWVYEFERVEKP